MRNGSVRTLEIETPEGIVFTVLLAGPIVRGLAWLIDLIAIVAISSLLAIIPGMITPLSMDLAQALNILLYFGVSLGYGIVLEWFWRGQTLGKRLFRLRVVDEQGLRLHFHQIALRNLLRPADQLPILYMLGGIVAALNSRFQRLGDFAGGTVVARLVSPRDASPDVRADLKFNSFRDYPHIEARLRNRASPVEAAIGVEALRRRDELEPQARIDLFRAIADQYKALAAFPEEATSGITDEQYVRNAIDSIHRVRHKSPETALNSGKMESHQVG